MDLSHLILLIALCVQLYGVGLIWFCQIVVYPLFAKVGSAEYTGYHRFYAANIPLPVILPGFASFFLPVAVLLSLPASVPLWMAWANVMCGLVGLLVTVGLEIPRHGKLERGGKNDETIRQLILYNWPRTASITVSAGLTLAMALHAFAPVLASD